MEELSEADTETEGHDHRTIARYLKHFLEYVPEEVRGAKEALEYKLTNPDKKPDLEDGGTPYMEDDGSTDEPEI